MHKNPIKFIRKKTGLTQQQLADKLGIHQTMVCRMEAGKKPIRGPVAILVEKMVQELVAA